jgi:lipopolysaccharide/colanic/teichoic acid biosynthesis glycosyltransferase
MASPRGKPTPEQSRAKVAVIPKRLPTRHAKRLIDIMLAAAGLLLLSPLLAIVAVAIKLDSRGPIFCREILYGYAHQKIRAFKFRRVSRIGSVLHQTGIDQLPQLLNVLLGEMSIVGSSAFTNRQDLAKGHFTSLLKEFNPGLTGRAQLIEARNGPLTAERRIAEDTHYVENWSVLLDLKIILMTLLSQKAAAESPQP